MEFNPLHFMWVSYTLSIIVGGLHYLHFKKYQSRIFRRLYGYGKLNKDFTEKSFVGWFEVPKRWFSHFYIIGTICFAYITMEVLRTYFTRHSSIPLIKILDFCTSHNRKSTVNPESIIILAFLLTLQVSRRCYECLFVSIYSDARINAVYYIIGMTYYFGVGLTLISEAPGFGPLGSSLHIHVLNRWLQWQHLMGTVIFLFGFVVQFQVHKDLASLRMNNTGTKVSTLDHVMPEGGWFEYVSCPHYFAEILIYFSANVILGGRSYTWWLLCLWVVSNQVLSALMSHQWYKEKFKSYPKNRKAVFPLLL